MPIASIDLRTNIKLPPTLECAKRIGEVIGLQRMHASFDTDNPVHGGITGAHKGHRYVLTWQPHVLHNTQDRTNVPCIMFTAKAGWMNVDLQWFLPLTDLMNEHQRKRFAEGMGNRMLDMMRDFELGAPDISQKGHWTDDEDISKANIEKAVEKLKDEEAKGA